ncbi:MAG TPA: hypothetical protein EYG17_09820 [Acidimicrobiia bacterium]|nr:hypothetical protein [Acidimicrobiia bacterium]
MAPESSTLKKGTRVVLIAELPGVGAGTAGRVGRAIGIKATRYRVSFDNGVESLSVAEGKLVSPAAWEYIQNNSVESGNGEKSRATSPAVPMAATPAVAAAVVAEVAKQPPVDTPSQPAAQKPAPTESPAAVQGDGSATDERLAALTSKSRDARKAAGVDVDAETVSIDIDEDVASGDEQEQDDPPDANSTPNPLKESTPPLVEVPEGYYPPDNRIADLLSAVRAK